MQGEYGIGKSSIARYVQFLAAEKHSLLPIYVSLSPSQTPEDLAARIVEGAMHSGQIHPSRGDKLADTKVTDEGMHVLTLYSAGFPKVMHLIGDWAYSDIRFLKQDVEQGLDDSERKKFNNFLQKMKTLNVLHSGTVKGEYVFNMSLVRLYLFLQRAKLARRTSST